MRSCGARAWVYEFHAEGSCPQFYGVHYDVVIRVLGHGERAMGVFVRKRLGAESAWTRIVSAGARGGPSEVGGNVGMDGKGVYGAPTGPFRELTVE